MRVRAHALYMSGQPCVPTAPPTLSGLDSTAPLPFTLSLRMHPWNSGSPGTGVPSGGHTVEQQLINLTIERSSLEVRKLFDWWPQSVEKI